MVSVMTVDFSKTPDHRMHKSGKLRDKLPTNERPRTADGKLLTPRQIRARYRRKANRVNMMSTQELEALYYKPITDWDLEELARGRPRNGEGNFRGATPKWINREMHERAMDFYKAAVRSDMNATTVDALTVLKRIINNDEVDEKGKMVVPASTKVDAAKFLIEHVVGKPMQRIESDVSVKLQAILGTVMVNPTEALMDVASGGQGYTLAHMPGITMPFGTADEEIIDAEFEDAESGSI